MILQFGGQTAIKLAKDLDDRNIKILGSSFKSLDETEDRDKFNLILEEHKILSPKGSGIYSIEQGIQIAKDLGYPVLVRPSYVIGGFGMEIVHQEKDLIKYLEAAFVLNPDQSVLIDQFLKGIEVEVDAICDGQDIFIPGIMEHIEEAGVHSGDSIAVYPTLNVNESMERQIIDTTEKIGRAFNLSGIFNVQYIIYNQELYVIEVNPRASRTIPMMSKVTNVPMIEMATRIMMGQTIKEMGYYKQIKDKPDFYAVKNPVFSMEKLSEAEIALNPEMKSTGETLTIDPNLENALLKGLLASNNKIPLVGKALISVSDAHKEDSIRIIKLLEKFGFDLEMTAGTKKATAEAGIKGCEVSYESIAEKLKNREYTMVLNIPTKGKDKIKEGFLLRRLCVEHKIPCFTSLNTIHWILKIMEKNIDIEDTSIFDICSIQ